MSTTELVIATLIAWTLIGLVVGLAGFVISRGRWPRPRRDQEAERHPEYDKGYYFRPLNRVCPTCKAQPGDYCRNSLDQMTTMHASRLLAPQAPTL